MSRRTFWSAFPRQIPELLILPSISLEASFPRFGAAFIDSTFQDKNDTSQSHYRRSH